MKRILFLIVLGGILFVSRANECNAAELGDCITVEGVNYEVTDNKTKLAVAVIGFQMNEDQENNEKIFINYFDECSVFKCASNKCRG